MMMMMTDRPLIEVHRVIVCGGRRYGNAGFLFRRLDELHRHHRFNCLIEGGANGADALAWRWVTRHPEIKHFQIKAKWHDLSHPDAVIRTRLDGSQYDAMAGHRRNTAMLGWKPDAVIAFSGGTGTRDMIEQARAAGVWVIEVHDPRA
jgi:hypothetical protein